MTCLALLILCSSINPPDYKEVITATTSAYVCTLDEECIMADGKRAITGVSIACPRNIPLETRIRIDQDILICQDRTNSRFNVRFDRFIGYMDDDSPARVYGLQVKRVEVL